MADHEAQEAENFPEVQDVSIVGAVDWFLQSTIETVINSGVDIGVTLTVGGAIVSGILISGRKYFEELGDALSAASQTEGDMQSVLGGAWKQYTAIYDRPEDAPEDWQAPPAGFIHLRNAKFHGPGQPPIPTNQGVLWRGKLSSVDGFSIGNFSAE